jgi:hypothetical protein
MRTQETARPEQYLRLLVMRLLETQQCLRPIIHEMALAPVKAQFLTNEYTLSEVKSWLEALGDNSPLGPSPSSARAAEISGPESPPSRDTSTTTRTSPTSPFVWHVRPEVSLTPSEVRSSLPSSTKLPDSAEILNGRVTFQPASSPTRPRST